VPQPAARRSETALYQDDHEGRTGESEIEGGDVERIRKDHRDEGLSIRALAARHEVHRRTVRQALANATPPERARSGPGLTSARGA